jgi:hypothetical protein
MQGLRGRLHLRAQPTQEQVQGLRGASICTHRRVRCMDCKPCKAELTRRTTRRAQVLEAHAVVVGALLSALARLIHWRYLQMRLTAGLACIHRVSFRAHTIAHTIAHTGTCSGAHVLACIRNVAYAHSTSLTRSQDSAMPPGISSSPSAPPVSTALP